MAAGAGAACLRACVGWEQHGSRSRCIHHLETDVEDGLALKGEATATPGTAKVGCCCKHSRQPRHAQAAADIARASPDDRSEEEPRVVREALRAAVV